MVSSRLGSRLGVVRNSRLEEPGLSVRDMISKRPSATVVGGPAKKGICTK